MSVVIVSFRFFFLFSPTVLFFVMVLLFLLFLVILFVCLLFMCMYVLFYPYGVYGLRIFLLFCCFVVRVCFLGDFEVSVFVGVATFVGDFRGLPLWFGGVWALVRVK